MHIIIFFATFAKTINIISKIMKFSGYVLLACLTLSTATATAQDAERASSSINLTQNKIPNTMIVFDIEAEGKKLPVRWGMDVAWANEQNVRKGVNHIGKENLSIVRGSFQTTKPLINDTDLTSAQITMLKERMRLINIVGDTVDVILNEDQEAGIDEYYVKNGNADEYHWAAMINASVKWIQQNYPKHTVIAVSPFNEPDYSWGQGSKSDFKAIAKILKEDYPLFKDIAITAGNTLNCDKALEWYNAVKPYVTWGNTHQLAGSFDTYAGFFTQVKKDGNIGYADELHNVGEAMIGAEYGMEAAVWWGFDSRARGEFCQISNHGSRIGYAESRDTWTASSVYRNDETGKVKAFIGSSERQANTAEHGFISKDREVYFDGHGPMREYTKEIPGGAKGSYQNGQTNAECVVDITWGEDVQPSAINGRYKIMNKATQYVVSVYGTMDGNANISQTKYSGGNHQLWDIKPIDQRIGGDYSFYDIKSAEDGYKMDVLNHGLGQGTNVIAIKGGGYNTCQQWYLEYAGNGYYYIRSRESARYLTLNTNAKRDGINIVQFGLLSGTNVDRQLWRIIPADAECEIKAPAQPTGLNATAQAASVKLEWTANTEEDLDGYMILRADEGKDNWNTIARKIKTLNYIDNTCQQGKGYVYKIKAIDKSENMSVASETVAATTTAERGVIAEWQLEGNFNDATANAFDAISPNAIKNINGHKDGSKGANVAATHIRLPYQIADMDEMSIELWANWQMNSNSWERLFDFGNGTDQYMFLTPSNGSGVMRFAIKNGGSEQTVDCTSKLTARKWKHIVVTIGKDKTAIYIDGELAGSSTGITIKPSDIRPALNYIGRSQFASDPYFSGWVDNIRIYNFALSAEDVKAAMNGEVSGIENIESDNSSIDAIYDIGGRRTDGIGNGINIIKTNKGDSKKVYIKR